MIAWLYQNVLKPIVFRIDPELVHDAFVKFGILLGKTSFGRFLVRAMYGYRGPDVSRIIDGNHYRTPILLAAGFDYNARLCQILPNMGFGGAEVGSVTAQPCPGNPKPRLRRLIQSKSLLVNKGLRNDGSKAILAHLQQNPPPPGFVLGVSIARTNSPDTVGIEASIQDYCETFKRFTEADVGDYYTINISCPNVFGGENFADAERLEKLCAQLMKIPCKKPIYAKMPIQIEWPDFHNLLKILDNYGFAGVVIGNLAKNYELLDKREEAPKDYQGGISGKPCFALSNALIRKTRETYGKRFTIIGCGGILSPEDALLKMEAGADLLQMITGMIFTGPQLMSDIAHKLANSPAPRHITQDETAIPERTFGVSSRQ